MSSSCVRSKTFYYNRLFIFGYPQIFGPSPALVIDIWVNVFPRQAMSTFVSNGSWGNGLSAIDELLKSCADSKKEHLTKEFRCNVILRKQFVTWWKKYLYILKALFYVVGN